MGPVCNGLWRSQRQAQSSTSAQDSCRGGDYLKGGNHLKEGNQSKGGGCRRRAAWRGEKRCREQGAVPGQAVAPGGHHSPRAQNLSGAVGEVRVVQPVVRLRHADQIHAACTRTGLTQGPPPAGQDKSVATRSLLGG